MSVAQTLLSGKHKWKDCLQRGAQGSKSDRTGWNPSSGICPCAPGIVLTFLVPRYQAEILTCTCLPVRMKKGCVQLAELVMWLDIFLLLSLTLKARDEDKEWTGREYVSWRRMCDIRFLMFLSGQGRAESLPLCLETAILIHPSASTLLI